MKRKIVCFALLSILIICILSTTANANTSNEAQKKLGNIHVDLTAVLKQLGYTEKNMSEAPNQLLLQIVRSYQPKCEVTADGDYYYTYTPNSPPAPTNIIGSNTLVPRKDSDSMPADQAIISNITYNSTNYQYNQKACLVFAIMDYPGIQFDLPYLWNSYNIATGNITTCGNYDYWNFLTDGDCTHYNIWAWITWACATYESVDVIWIGHGTQFLGDTCFVSYDSLDGSLGIVYPWNLYSSWDFYFDYRSNPYDYSTLRVGIGDFCYGYGFSNHFLNPIGSVDHDRAFTGPVLESNVGYSYEFICEWSDCFYPNNYNSYDSWNYAQAAAADRIQTGESGYSYDGDAVWC